LILLKNIAKKFGGLKEVGFIKKYRLHQSYLKQILWILINNLVNKKHFFLQLWRMSKENKRLKKEYQQKKVTNPLIKLHKKKNEKTKKKKKNKNIKNKNKSKKKEKQEERTKKKNKKETKKKEKKKKQVKKKNEELTN